MDTDGKKVVLRRSPPFRALKKRYGIVLTDDDQLRAFANAPEERFKSKAVNTAMDGKSLREICETAAKYHCEILTFFHDHFFGGGERTLHLTHPEFIECTRKISEYAAKYGMGIGASVTNPLDLGRTFKRDMGVGGQHRTFCEGLLETDGSFHFNAYLAKRWCNNKGYIYPKFDRARLFTYTETKKEGSPYVVIPYDTIIEIPETDYTCVPSEEPWEESGTFGNSHMVVSGKTALSGNRVFAVFYMDTPEMDYFHPEVTNYVHSVIDLYRECGVEFEELYSDEMHIQFDWDFAHFGPHELPTRYMTANFEKTLSEDDAVFKDFDRALLYMCYDTSADREAYSESHTQHVIGTSPEELYRTFRMRKTYFDTLQDKVVGICCEARDYIKATYTKKAGEDPLCLGHATWQESPTCDKYTPKGMFGGAVAAGVCTYDYTPEYVYSSTIREAISGCYDYFKWNDYFSYGGNDFCECGWFDRNYYGGAMAASLGALNRNEIASWGAWGFPNEARRRFNAVSLSFGATNDSRGGIVNWNRPRVTDVAYVYPKDLTSVEERFGSWMVQYAYANYITDEKIVSIGEIKDGKLRAGLGEYSTVVVGFEPFYNEKFVKLLERFAAEGGTVIWCGAPPCDKTGRTPDEWLDTFGIKRVASIPESAAAGQIAFYGEYTDLTPMRVPTDMLPDRVYPLKPLDDSRIIARADGETVGISKAYGKGRLLYMGCRLRDDQSGDSDDSPSTLFDFLKLSGAYGGSRSEDNTETISRKTEYFATRFANGAYSVANHYRKMKELWAGGFGRDAKADAEALASYQYMAPIRLTLKDFTIDGHKVTYEGDGALQFRLSEGTLVGFRGENTVGVIIDGKEYRFTDEPSTVIFNDLAPDRIPDGFSRGRQIFTTAKSLALSFTLPQNARFFLNPGCDGRNMSEITLTVSENSRICIGEYAGCDIVVLDTE